MALALAVGIGLAAHATAQSTPPPLSGQPTPTPATSAPATLATSSFELGYNALQAGLFEGGNGRVRAYDTIEGLAGPLRLGWYGINEGGPGYRYGQNTVGLGLTSRPGISLIVAFKHDDSGGHTFALAQDGVGVRLDDRALPLPLGMYYNLQLFKNLGAGSTESHEVEGILLLGKTFLGHDATLYLDWQRHADPYFELEIVSPGVFEMTAAQARLWIRVEGTHRGDAKIGGGLQLQPK